MTVDQWQNRIKIKSEKSNNVYTVSQRISSRLWECSCPGWKSHRQCKHLRNMGLPTIGPQGLTGESRGKSTAGFAESREHYDPMSEGYGNAADWKKAAERVIAGKGAIKIPAARSEPLPAMTADIRALGMSAMPATADGLHEAFQRRAAVLDDPVTGNPDEFWKVFAAYERLAEFY